MTRTTLYSILLIFGIALAFSACKNREKIQEPEAEISANTSTDPAQVDSVIIPEVDTPEEPVQVLYYERTVCFGRCPSFVFTAMSNGSCTYNGRNFVDRIGQYTGTIDPAQFESVFQIAEELDYASLDDKYDNPMVTDLPATITGVKGKQVINRYQGPDLKKLYTALDSLTEQVVWKMVDKQ